MTTTDYPADQSAPASAETLTTAVRAMNPHIDIETTWDEQRWRPVDPEGPGPAIAWIANWYEDNPMHDGPEPMSTEGPLDTLRAQIAEILDYPNLIPSAGIHLDLCGWALLYTGPATA